MPASAWGTASEVLSDPAEPGSESAWGTDEVTLTNPPAPSGTSYWGTASTTIGGPTEWWIRSGGSWVPLDVGFWVPM